MSSEREVKIPMASDPVNRSNSNLGPAWARKAPQAMLERQW